ncbi:hypothetical protein ORI20_13970 [Mycobacterium sp. CVI_P3]|uniref:Antitoxin n=1 Tax=Mycobacterium pinniadriaticum TaxID=2994102 RepID=A0ABT3SE69_9MYCO|nr:hypothetical protein [Mycobacterium pinniadriaticum]MCX2931387.1 hypothetical protein [Mycobacterium pinniadriaticum]MCX2937811.1 hypothetical protein [Mycobacterium pinniadriaticum]
MSSSFMARVRLDEDLWSAAMARAEAEGTTASALVRQWLADYVETGAANPTGRRAPGKVRTTAAERARAADAVDADRIVAAVVDALNESR